MSHPERENQLQQLEKRCLDELCLVLAVGGHVSPPSALLLAMVTPLLPSWKAFKKASKGVGKLKPKKWLVSPPLRAAGVVVCFDEQHRADAVYLADADADPGHVGGDEFLLELVRYLTEHDHTTKGNALALTKVGLWSSWQQRSSKQKMSAVLGDSAARSLGLVYLKKKNLGYVYLDTAIARSVTTTTTTTAADADAYDGPAASLSRGNTLHGTFVRNSQEWKAFVQVVNEDRKRAYAVDTEGILNENGHVSLVQIFVPSNGTTYLFHESSWTGKKAKFWHHLKEILEHPSITIVMHDARADARTLLAVHDINLSQRPLGTFFDVQIALARLDDHTQRLGLNALLERCGQPLNTEKDDIKKQFQAEPAFWDELLSREARAYAVMDVCYLIEAYEYLRAELESQDLLARVLAESRDATLPPQASDAPDGGASTAWFLSTTEDNRMALSSQASPGHSPTRRVDASIDTAVLEVLPEAVACALHDHPGQLVEVLMDAGKDVELHFSCPEPPYRRYQTLEGVRVTRDMLCEFVFRLGLAQRCADGEQDHVQQTSMETLALESTVRRQRDAHTWFSTDNRAGIPETLHRVSWYVNARGTHMGGITCRIGRPIEGAAGPFQDLIMQRVAGQQESLLLIGQPGSGKTTVLRGIIALLASKFGPSVVVVDTSNEIGGFGDAPHPMLGRARRIPVPDRDQLADKLREAVQNHNPRFVVVDELSSRQEAAAVTSITRRGVAVIATVHGKSLKHLCSNPDLRGLMGNVSRVILSGREVAAERERNGVHADTRRNRMQRQGNPSFELVIECEISLRRYTVHEHVADSVDALLQDKELDLSAHTRWIDAEGYTRCCFAHGMHPRALE